MLSAAEADTAGVPPDWTVGAFRLLPRFGNAPVVLSSLPGDVSAAADELGAGVTVALGGIDGVTIALGAGGGVTLSGAWGVNAGELIGTVCFSNSRATLLSLPRSPAGAG